MISSTLIQAAEVLLEALTPQNLGEADAKRAMADAGLGYYGVNAYVDNISQADLTVEEATTYAFMTGVIAERLFQRLSEDPSAAEHIKTAVQLHRYSPEEKMLSFIDEMADILYYKFDTEVPDTATGREIIELVRHKYEESSDTDAADRLTTLLTKLDALDAAQHELNEKANDGHSEDS